MGSGEACWGRGCTTSAKPVSLMVASQLPHPWATILEWQGVGILTPLWLSLEQKLLPGTSVPSQFSWDTEGQDSSHSYNTQAGRIPKQEAAQAGVGGRVSWRRGKRYMGLREPHIVVVGMAESVVPSVSPEKQEPLQCWAPWAPVGYPLTNSLIGLFFLRKMSLTPNVAMMSGSNW